MIRKIFMVAGCAVVEWDSEWLCGGGRGRTGAWWSSKLIWCLWTRWLSSNLTQCGLFRLMKQQHKQIEDE